VREQKARYQLGKLDRYKKALELCKEQRNEYCDSASYSARFITKEMIKSDDKEIEEILESEAADES
jgi:F0F1-type ATP synthase membrane subunit b/b'